MKIKGHSTATLETMVKWAISKEATSIFIACINKIHKQSIERGINPVVVLSIAAFNSKFGKFDVMCNESHCNLFYKIIEDDNIYVKRYKTWSDGIKEFLDDLENEMNTKYITEIEDIGSINPYKNMILEYIGEIVNTHMDNSTTRILFTEDESMKDVFISHDNEVKELNDKIMELQEKLIEKDEIIYDLSKSIEDMKEEIKITNKFKDILKDFLK